MTAPLTVKQAAAEVGLHYDTFREGWRAMVRDQGFPAPFPAGKRLRWDPAAVADWKARRSADQAERLRRPKAANDLSSPPVGEGDRAAGVVEGRIARQQDQLFHLMQGARA